MKDSIKALQLKKHKQLATGLFLLMLMVYIATTYLSTQYAAAFLGYIGAFSEAAMIGALADWFAVTALFYHPLGLPIPHTNLIEKSKKNIGDNLGNFVVSNFLTAANIRPYIKKLRLSSYVAQWLSIEKNKQMLIAELSWLLNDIIQKTGDKAVVNFIVNKGSSLVKDIKLNNSISNGAHYFIEKGEHEKLITVLAARVKEFIIQNETLVREKVKQQSFFLIPGFVEKKLADKISNGLMNYFSEIEQDREHAVRKEITEQLYNMAASIKTDAKWDEIFQQLKDNLLSNKNLEQYAADAWQSIKASLQKELSNPDSSLLKYFGKSMDELAHNLNNDLELQKRIDGWIQHTAYKYILRNTEEMGVLISDTVGNWQGRALSEKLELEVGKDLQFIRINGTLVGGLVGLLIHTITHILL